MNTVTYQMDGPDGKTYEIDGPEGATEEEVIAAIQANMNKAPAYNEANRNADRLNAAGQGLSLGWLDELGSFMGSRNLLPTGVLGDAHPARRREGETPEEAYDRLQALQSDRRRAYTDEHTGEALGLEVLGGLSTGVAGLARTLGRQGVKQIAKQASKPRSQFARADAVGEAAEQGSRLRDVAKGAGTVLGESALAGAGTAQEGSRAEGAVAGAAMGAATAGALKGLGKGVEFATKRRVAQELGEGDDFVPLNIAADNSMLGKFYQEFLGRTWGGGELLRQQSARVGGIARRRLDRAKEKMTGVKASLAREKEAATDAAEAARLRTLEEGNARIDTEAARQQGALRKAKKQGKREVGKRLAQALDDDAAKLRVQAAKNSMPPDAPGELVDEVSDLAARDPQQAAEKMDNWWVENGFLDARSRDYEWTGELQQRINALGADPTLALELGDVFKRIPGMAAKMDEAALRAGGGQGLGTPDQLAAFTQAMSDSPNINGEAMMAMRNLFARWANKSSDEGRRYAMRRVADAFDDEMRRQMDDEGVALFNAHKAMWGTKEQFGNATESAARKKQGLFDADTWLSTRTAKPREFRHGKGGLQRTAQEMQLAQKSRAAQAQDALDEMADRVTDEAVGIRSNQAIDRYQLQQTAQTAKKQALRRAKVARKEDARKLTAKEAEDAARDELRRITAASPPENPSGLSSVLTTMALGAPFSVLGAAAGPIAGGAAGVASGTALARTMASPGFQRMVAGQTRRQARLRRTLEETRKRRQQLYRGTYRTSALVTGED